MSILDLYSSHQNAKWWPGFLNISDKGQCFSDDYGDVINESTGISAIRGALRKKLDDSGRVKITPQEGLYLPMVLGARSEGMWFPVAETCSYDEAILAAYEHIK